MTSKYRVVRVKTLDEFHHTGWMMTSEGSLVYHFDEENEIVFLRSMRSLHGKIIPIYTHSVVYGNGTPEYIYTDENGESVIISERMIQEDFDVELYPEFFI